MREVGTSEERPSVGSLENVPKDAVKGSCGEWH